MTSEIDLLGKGLELRGTTDEAGLPLSRLIGSGGHRLLNQCGGVFDEQVWIRDLVISEGDNSYLYFGGAGLCFQQCKVLLNVEVHAPTVPAASTTARRPPPTAGSSTTPGPEDEVGNSFDLPVRIPYSKCSISRNGGHGFVPGQGGEHRRGRGGRQSETASSPVAVPVARCALVICGNDGSQMSGSFVDGGDNCISTACGDSDEDR